MKELKEFAERLTKGNDGRRIEPELIKEAKEKGIVVVYGYSDDNLEFDGAIYDEAGCYDGGTAYLDGDKVFEECECDYCKKNNPKEKHKSITANWCKGEWTWSYDTDIPHETFEMIDDGEKFCLGIVFYKKDVM